MLSNKIELIPVDIIQKYPNKLALIDKVVKQLDIIVGWHYILDIIWILNQVEEHKLPEGSVILDAGGGHGVIQFCLAKLKYKVISIDFTDRRPTKKMLKYFDITESVITGEIANHNYLKFLNKSHPRPGSGSLNRLKSFLNKFILYRPQNSSSISQADFKDVSPGNRHPLVFQRADLQDLSHISADSIDAIVSVSVLEHNNEGQNAKIMSELKRTLKNGKPMFITTSVSEKEDWFHEASKGWVYSEKSLHNLFLNSCEKFKSNFTEYNRFMNGLRISKELKSRLHKVYFKSGNNGMPWGVWDPKYYPVGLVYHNDKS